MKWFYYVCPRCNAKGFVPRVEATPPWLERTAEMAKSKGICVIEGIGTECAVTGGHKAVCKVRFLDGSLSGELGLEEIFKTVKRKEDQLRAESEARGPRNPTQTTP